MKACLVQKQQSQSKGHNGVPVAVIQHYIAHLGFSHLTTCFWVDAQFRFFVDQKAFLSLSPCKTVSVMDPLSHEMCDQEQNLRFPLESLNASSSSISALVFFFFFGGAGFITVFGETSEGSTTVSTFLSPKFVTVLP